MDPVLRRRGQRIFLGIIAGFMLFLVGSIIVRSGQRRSLNLGGGIETTEVSVEGSGVRLQDFRRLQTNEGKKVWSVQAKEASYYAAEDVAHVNDPQVILYREDGSEIQITALAGKLYLRGEQLKRAELEGGVVIRLDPTLTIESPQITYDAIEQLATSATTIVVNGAGYRVSGVGMRAAVDKRIIDLLSQVVSKFEQAAQFPQKSLNVLNAKQKK